jgi:hypothetical protein
MHFRAGPPKAFEPSILTVMTCNNSTGIRVLERGLPALRQTYRWVGLCSF